tara:strand:- start:7459 stop:7743 length:285 start_codon:yes stop_codon:yes gene_type:complete
MKNAIIIFNLLFLFFGNSIFSNIHYLDEHAHQHQEHTEECIECIVIKNTENYTLDINPINFGSHDCNYVIIKDKFVIISSKNKLFSSRAPPTSK